MYVIGVIITIKLYQCRHPDIHPSSQKVFLFLALCILINVLGVVIFSFINLHKYFFFIIKNHDFNFFLKFYGKSHFWFVISYSIGHLAFFFCLSVVIYYMNKLLDNIK